MSRVTTDLEDDRYARALQERFEARRSLGRNIAHIRSDLTEMPTAMKAAVRADVSNTLNSLRPSELIRRYPGAAIAVSLVAGVSAGLILLPQRNLKRKAGKLARSARRAGTLKSKLSGFAQSYLSENHSAFSEAALKQARGIGFSLLTSLATSAATALLHRLTAPPPKGGAYGTQQTFRG